MSFWDDTKLFGSTLLDAPSRLDDVLGFDFIPNTDFAARTFTGQAAAAEGLTAEESAKLQATVTKDAGKQAVFIDVPSTVSKTAGFVGDTAEKILAPVRGPLYAILAVVGVIGVAYAASKISGVVKAVKG